MRTTTRCLAALLVVVATSPVAAQDNQLILDGVLRARAVLAAGIDAMGGLAALEGLSDVTRVMSGSRTDWGQGLRSGEASANRPRMVSVRDLKGVRWSDELADTIMGGQPLNFRGVGGPKSAVSLNLITGYSRALPPSALSNMQTRRWRMYPETLLRAAWGRPESLRWVGNAMVNGRQHQVISYADADGEQIALFFDAASHLLTRAGGVTDDPFFGDIEVYTLYDDYRPVGAVRLPFHQVEVRGDKPLTDLRASSIRIDTRPDDSLFATPASVRPWPNTTPSEPIVKLADGVYLAEGSYNSLFVVFREYVLVVEAGAGSRATQATINRIKEAAPGKPIRYVVATHFHADHMGGVRSYVAEGTTVVTTRGGADAVRHAAAARHVMRPDALSRTPRDPVIETLTGRSRVFDDGTRRVELHQIGPTPHVDEMILVYLPKERILYEADALDIDIPADQVGTPVVGDDTRHLARKIDELGLVVERIVPTHGRVGTIEDLRQSIGRRVTSR
jgi:glyoxylase-like metal-dependent hydrolase (beta-lactamase superfamily II)